ncbi:MAG TPA: phosphoribosylaminoimidazolesuccinocarboxamide synthase [Bacteroidia bacterium]|nr:phosphoribosylaminoimidazolesuccinocarboxamide synthase [Bacteroidia bacterium]
MDPLHGERRQITICLNVLPVLTPLPLSHHFSRDNPADRALLHGVKALLPSDLGEPFYEGSVQRLYAVPDDDSVMVTRTTSRGSVFDVGALFEIPGNDVNRALFRHVLYSRMGDPAVWRRVRGAIESAPELDAAFRGDLLGPFLESCCEQGARTHHEGMLDSATGEVVRSGVPTNPSACNVVRKYQILKPERVRVLGAPLFDYSQFPHSDRFVVPLEYIVRFGITSASSVFRKYAAMDAKGKAAFERELGVSRPLEAWQYLERPISDFTSKFEPEDRMVSKQEALAMCGLSGEQFARSGLLAVLGAWVVRDLVEEIGLRLWDLKWEFAKDGDDLVFVDTIDTDSIRATLVLETVDGSFAIHYNKQAMRDYFTLLHGDWITGIQEAKALGQKEGVAFTEILKEGQAEGRFPATPSVEEEFLALQEEKMAAIRDHITGAEAAGAVRERLEAAGRAEIGFYAGRGVLADLRKINGI